MWQDSSRGMAALGLWCCLDNRPYSSSAGPRTFNMSSVEDTSSGSPTLGGQVVSTSISPVVRGDYAIGLIDGWWMNEYKCRKRRRGIGGHVMLHQHEWSAKILHGALFWWIAFLHCLVTNTQDRHTNILANLTGNIWLQAPSEDLVNDAVTVVWIVGLLPIVISCGPQRAESINRRTDNTNNLFSTSERLSGPISHLSITLQSSLSATSQLSGF